MNNAHPGNESQKRCREIITPPKHHPPMCREAESKITPPLKVTQLFCLCMSFQIKRKHIIKVICVSAICYVVVCISVFAILPPSFTPQLKTAPRSPDTRTCLRRPITLIVRRRRPLIFGALLAAAKVKQWLGRHRLAGPAAEHHVPAGGVRWRRVWIIHGRRGLFLMLLLLELLLALQPLLPLQSFDSVVRGVQHFVEQLCLLVRGIVLAQAEAMRASSITTGSVRHSRCPSKTRGS